MRDRISHLDRSVAHSHRRASVWATGSDALCRDPDIFRNVLKIQTLQIIDADRIAFVLAEFLPFIGRRSGDYRPENPESIRA